MKIGIVGSGAVGATAAYAMVMQGVGREIVLIDQNKERAEAEADDILHAVPFAHALKVRAGEYQDLANSKVVIVTAGVAQKPNESRLELLNRNAAIFREIIPAVLSYARDAAIIITTNPVDIMTHVAAHFAQQFGIPPHRILGSGTTLDTARFRSLLGQSFGVDSSHIHAYVVGEHGDSEVLNWSAVSIAGIPLQEFCEQHNLKFCETEKETIDFQVRNAAYKIIQGKGATNYGIGSALARITNVIIRDQRAIMTVCAPLKNMYGVENLTFSIPRLVGGDGVLDAYPPVLNVQERADLERSAQVISNAIQGLEL